MQTPSPLPSRAELLDLFDYDSVEGILKWRDRPGMPKSARHHIGKAVGFTNSAGRLQVNLDGKCYLVARIVYKILHDIEPPVVRTINGIHKDLRAHNLTESTASKIQRNRPPNALSGAHGVYYETSCKAWRVMLTHNGHSLYFGVFADVKEAALLAKNAIKALETVAPQ
jgi:hypothetical protein